MPHPDNNATNAGHGKDHRRAAGGFIHGIRYTARALFRSLMSKYQDGPWPATSMFVGVEQWGAAQDGNDAECLHCPESKSESKSKSSESESSSPPPPLSPFERGLGLGGPGCNAGDLATAGGCKEPVNIRSPFEFLLNKIFSRIYVADGPYAMIAVLADAVVFRCKPADGSTASSGVDAEYLEELPVDYINERYDKLPRFVWHFGYV